MKNNKLLLLGDQAIALGAIQAGISGVYAYPGTPSTEITEYIQDSPLARERCLHSSWCTNEKTAMEAAGFRNYSKEWWHYYYMDVPQLYSYDVPLDDTLLQR